MRRTKRTTFLILIHLWNRMKQRPLASILSSVQNSVQVSIRLLPPLVLLLILSACNGVGALPTPSHPNRDSPLVVYGWAGYVPEAVLQAFTEDTGIEINYVAYESYDAAITMLQAGARMDVLIMGSERIVELAEQDLLAPINYSNVPNFRNVPAGFRDLAFDPNNTYTVPFQWGTTGLIVRTDLVERPVTHWADLWDPAFAGRVGVWPMESSLIGIALKSLGYSINTEDRAELEEAAQRLNQLATQAILLDSNLAHAGEILGQGDVAIIYGWPYDYHETLNHSAHAAYILPAEGAIIWVESLILPAASTHKTAAEMFINHVLKPEIAGLIVNEVYVAMPNDAALDFISSEIRNDPSIFPTLAELAAAEMQLTVSPATTQFHTQMMLAFLAYYE